MDLAKIRLSEEEMKLVRSKEFILTKNRILQKTHAFLQALEKEQRNILQRIKLPSAAMQVSPKISRGEQYEGLPWLVLDNPRVFGRADTLAIRTLFWWGESVIMTLLLSGAYRDQYLESISAHYDELQSSDMLVGIHTNPWVHHVREENFLPVQMMDRDSFQRHLHEHSFIKLARTYSITEWEILQPQLLEDYSFFVKMLEEN